MRGNSALSSFVVSPTLPKCSPDSAQLIGLICGTHRVCQVQSGLLLVQAQGAAQGRGDPKHSLWCIQPAVVPRLTGCGNKVTTQG